MTHSIKTNFNIDDLTLDNPKIYKNKTYFKIYNPNNKNNNILINLYNVVLVDNTLPIDESSTKQNILKSSIECITDIENRNFLSLLDKKLEKLYYELIDKKKENLYYYDTILKLNNLQIISKFSLNKQLHLIEKLDTSKNYNIDLELYSIILDNNVIKVLWKLKSLEIIENNKNIEEENLIVLNYKINQYINYIRNQAQNELDNVKLEVDKIRLDYDNINNKYNKLDNLYKNILEENNIENLENIYKLFLENK
jgi:hypothetical protein